MNELPPAKTVCAPDHESGTGSLRGRIVAAYVVLAIMVCAPFAAAVGFVLETVEEQVIVEKLSAAADTLIARHRQGQPTEVPLDPTLLYGDMDLQKYPECAGFGRGCVDPVEVGEATTAGRKRRRCRAASATRSARRTAGSRRRARSPITRTMSAITIRSRFRSAASASRTSKNTGPCPGPPSCAAGLPPSSTWHPLCRATSPGA